MVRDRKKLLTDYNQNLATRTVAGGLKGKGYASKGKSLASYQKWTKPYRPGGPIGSWAEVKPTRPGGIPTSWLRNVRKRRPGS